MFSICIAAAYFIYPRQLNGGWATWIFTGVICTLLINAVYFIKYRKTPEFNVVNNKIIKLIKQSVKTSQ